jgi:hypothetical protein
VIHMPHPCCSGLATVQTWTDWQPAALLPNGAATQWPLQASGGSIAAWLGAHPLAPKHAPHVPAKEVEANHVGSQMHELLVAKGRGDCRPHPPRPQALDADDGVGVHLPGGGRGGRDMEGCFSRQHGR